MSDEYNQPAGSGRPRDAAIDGAVINAARAILAEAGYSAVSISAVARRAGLPRSTVYRRYPSLAALRYAAAFAPASGAYPLTETGDLRMDLTSHIVSNASAFRDRKSIELLRALTVDLLKDPAGRAVMAERYIQPRLRQIVELLERARERGQLPASVNSEIAAKAITGTLIYHAVLLDQEVDNAMIQALLDLVLPPDSNGGG